SKGKTILTLRVVENGKLKKKEISIKVKKEKPQKARPADNTGRRRNGSCGKSCPLNNFFAKAKSDFGNFFCRMKSVWNYLPDKKKLAYIVLGLIIVVMILASISPKLLIFGLMAIALYLFWIIFKK
ncbi:MAG: hypothetical protein LKJ93_04265, partial [Bacteroidales bacterium]|nr:hypothetical protein [Bacteroidales bacterium]